MDEKTTKEIIVSGRVQMVGFRWFTIQQAAAYGICGWVRNLPNGSVQILAQGKADAIAAFEDQVRKGPFHARVDQFLSENISQSPDYENFEIRG
ncbi:MAG TPA: acylphosphatase [Candidatus Marinimicrobia bacterium]|nr:acylphosphatase [Candidatus Neomarinimicrobiota bacterium]